MFPYDTDLLATVQAVPQNIPEVLRIMQRIEAICVPGDGLKWFNWLYMEVTNAVEARVTAGGFGDPPWLAELDVQFARLYFSALANYLNGQAAPMCWQALFQSRDRVLITRIQFALAGVNSHINHDLPQALVNTGDLSQEHYADYTALNSTLDSLIDEAKKTLLCRLLGEPVPPIGQLEDIVAAFSIGVVRQTAWQNAEILSHLRASSVLANNFLETLDALTTSGNRALLISVD